MSYNSRHRQRRGPGADQAIRDLQAKGRVPQMTAQKSSAPPAHPSTEEQDHPHACNDGWVTMGQIVVDSETGEETEEYAMYLCRRCTSAAGR